MQEKGDLEERGELGTYTLTILTVFAKKLICLADMILTILAMTEYLEDLLRDSELSLLSTAKIF